MHRIKPQQMRVGFHRAKVIDRHHLDIGPPRFDDGAQHIAPDAPEPVDCYLHGHASLLKFKRDSTPRGLLALPVRKCLINQRQNDT